MLNLGIEGYMCAGAVAFSGSTRNVGGALVLYVCDSELHVCNDACTARGHNATSYTQGVMMKALEDFVGCASLI